MKTCLLLLIYSSLIILNLNKGHTRTIIPCDTDLAKKLEYSPKGVIVPSGKTLDYRCEGKVKVFELQAEKVFNLFHRGFEPGPVYLWGYNGSSPGPLIEAIEGETIKVIFKNKLPEPTTVHWHGLELPIDMDGASGFSHPPVPSGEIYEYKIHLKQSGTYMYHSGHSIPKQLAMGLSGFVVVHPKRKPEIMVDHDFALFLQMWTIPPHSIIPDTMDMMFNFFTINGKSAPSVESLNVKVGDKVRIRFANISMMQHPIHLHGHTWYQVATGAGDNPRSSWTTGNTVLSPVGQTIDVVIENLEEPGDWLLHCHLPHHVTNNMEIEPVPGEMMIHGEAGMFTLFKVSKKMSENHTGHTGNDHYDRSNTIGPHDNHMKHKMKNKPKPGKYSGYLVLENGKKIKTVLEIYKAQVADEWRSLHANIKFFLGEFPNGEYEVFQLENIDYNFKENEMTMETLDKGIRIEKIKFMHKNKSKMFSGNLVSDYFGHKGLLKLDTSNLKKSVQSLTSLRGEYLGKCFERKTKLQIETIKGMVNESNKENNSFGTYAIKGRMGHKLGEKYRNILSIDEGNYDIFSGNLTLETSNFRGKSKLNCKVLENGEKLSCDNKCNFTKELNSSLKPEIPNDNFLSSYLNKLKPSGQMINEFSSYNNIDERYLGFLKLQHSEKIRPISFIVKPRKYAKRPMEIPRTFFTSSLNIYLGENFKSQSLIVKFKERPYLNSASKMNTKNENRLTLETENIHLVIKKWTKSGISASLYHKYIGLVGEVIVQKEFNSKHLENLKDYILLPLRTHLKTSKYTLNLNIVNDPHQEGIHGNLLYPLSLKGSIVGTYTASSSNIEFGTLNPFTGELFLMFSDGRNFSGFNSGDRITGNLSSNNKRRSLLRSKTTLNFK